VAADARAQGVELYLDLPVGVHADGYDAWRYQDLFVNGASVGAPPDIVTNSGQDWGFAPLHPERLRESGYEYVRRYLAHHFSAAGVLRLDHAMGLLRLYWVPHGMSPADGVYVRYNAEEQFAVLCLESRRAKAAVVGENLGIVPDAVNAGLARHGIGRMYVMSIELTGQPEQPFRRIPRDVVASFGTHDLPMFAAFWQDLDIDERVRLGVLDAGRAVIEREQRQRQKQALVTYLRAKGLLAENDAVKDAGPHPSPLPAGERGSEGGLEGSAIEEVLKGMTAALARSAAKRVLVNLEDLWLETRPQNVPGTTGDQHPNWQRRAVHGLDDFDVLPLLNEVVEMLRKERSPEPAND
jgi:4-alpha-glucanotransferase